MDKDAVRYEFERFVADSGPALLKTAYLMLWDLPSAEDLVQESLLKVAGRWPRVRKMDQPLAYARRILINEIFSGSERRARHRSELQIRPEGNEIRDEASVRELGFAEYRHELMRAVGSLPPRQRATLVLRYFEDLSEVQTAAILGCSVGTVKSTTARALGRLRSELGATKPDTTTVHRPRQMRQTGEVPVSKGVGEQ
jgi:RNA polymerase sigma-70 factor (sigma-E family)